MRVARKYRPITDGCRSPKAGLPLESNGARNVLYL
jgi:hypothetical protein